MDDFENKKRFYSSQNKIALLLFTVFALQLVASGGYTVVLQIMNLTTEAADSSEFGLVLQIVMYLFYIGLPILLYPLIGKRKLSRYVSFKAKLPRGGVAAVFLCVGLMYSGQVFSWLMSELCSTVGIQLTDTSTAVYSGVTSYILLFISTAVLPAFLEEILMRGIVLGELAPYGRSAAIIYSGFLFGLIHMNPVQLPFACIAGVAIAYFALESGSLWPGVIVHFINNALSVASEIMYNELSPSAYATVSQIIDITVFTLAVLSALYLFTRRRSLLKAPARTGTTPLCAAADEENRVDLSPGLFRTMSSGMLIYVVFALLCALSVPFLLTVSAAL